MKELGRNDLSGSVIVEMEGVVWDALRRAAGWNIRDAALRGQDYCDISVPRYWLIEALGRAVLAVGPWDDASTNTFMSEARTRYVLRVAEAMVVSAQGWLEMMAEEAEEAAGDVDGEDEGWNDEESRA